ncbi:MAG: hypothetical protein Q4G36_08805 [Paracoccus sp. (in: a-proteobacteria)]|nr:hypothetical protein [Paracoccus sp. (in: a-proteobacteria)]
MDIVNLGVDSVPEIISLLKKVWADSYGENSYPHFTEDYLRWLYGGPNENRNILRGVRNKMGDLIAFRVDLYRPANLNGQRRDAYVSRHLAIDPKASFNQRLSVAAEFGRLVPIERDRSAVSVAYYETEKHIAKTSKRLAMRRGMQIFEQRFSQFVVNRKKLLAKEESSIELEALKLTAADCDEAVNLLSSRSSEKSLLWAPNANELAYHTLNAPEHFSLIARSSSGKLVGLIGCYALDLMQASQKKRILICETLAVRCPNVANFLLRRALDYSDNVGARGVVIENASYLSDEVIMAAGLLRSPRQMIYAIRGIDLPPTLSEGFSTDLK